VKRIAMMKAGMTKKRECAINEMETLLVIWVEAGILFGVMNVVLGGIHNLRDWCCNLNSSYSSVMQQ
jgi:hypothetical protein